MKKINKSRYAILGSLLLKPQSGYELKKFMELSTNHFWQESDASIYPMLKKLAAEGKVTAQRESVGKRGLVKYAITQTGKKEFLQWLVLPAEPETSRNEFLLKLFFGAYMTPKNTEQQLTLRKKRIEDKAHQFKEIEHMLATEVSDDYPHKAFWLMTLRNGMTDVHAEHDWIENCINLVNKMEKEKDGNKN